MQRVVSSLRQSSPKAPDLAELLGVAAGEVETNKARICGLCYVVGCRRWLGLLCFEKPIQKPVDDGGDRQDRGKDQRPGQQDRLDPIEPWSLMKLRVR